ncbi:hypothetical protein [Paraglaciecola chathamensis]|uniref:hypothetical protein n=1 Tax=Paraglaciecola chathamensis TaxID=368405 RepID=UPI00270EC22E|nr:hypothetical protein [Paraglaciecola chathamensis]MDO6561158.1 hypothetical protein [Paraglaciecola chathamensis]
MENMNIKEAINMSGSVASITGISLLTLERSTPEISAILIISYLVASFLFIGGLGLIINVFISSKQYLGEKLAPLTYHSLILLLGAFGITGILFWAKVCHVIAKEFKYIVGWF